MVGRSLLLGILLVALLTVSTEGRKGKKRAALRNMMMADDSDIEPIVEAVQPLTRVGECSCKCCEDAASKLVVDPPCANDVIVAVDSSACFRDHHKRMVDFLTKLVSEFHKQSNHSKFGESRTRMSILQFSSDADNVAIPLNDFDNYRQGTSRQLRDAINERIGGLGFLGEGLFLDKALNKTVEEFEAYPRPEDIQGRIYGRDGKIRKVVILLSNGKSHLKVKDADIDYSVQYLRSNNVTLLPVSVTRRCYSAFEPEWDEGLCPDDGVMNQLSALSTWDENYLAMRARGTINAVVREATNCHFVQTAEQNEAPCNNCTCDCELPIGPKGKPGEKGPPGDSIKGPKGDVGPQGEKGDPGPIGYRGEDGPKGIKGEVGPIGDKGEVGPVGPKGNEGEVGAKGQKGEDGIPGDVGAKGSTGDKGDTGEKGSNGRKGSVGVEGPKGTKGEVGAKGDEGPKGEPGQDGLSIKGDEGPKGIIGPKGSDGLPGPPGMKGPKGMSGLCGKDGPPGPPGDAGLIGVDGQDGIAGPPGSQGPRGPEGLQGQKGERGGRGLDGIIGPIGPEGPAGPPGPSGEPGERGIDGRDSVVPGPEGPRGPKGERGVGGVDGSDGPEGNSGERGPRGYAGPKGDECSIAVENLKPLIVDIIIKLLPGDCETPTTTTPPATTTTLAIPVCHEKPVDVVFLIDGSDSIDRDDFRLIERWILKTLDRFEPSAREDPIQVDIVQYSGEIELSVHGLVTDSSEDIRVMVESIDQQRGASKAYTGLRFVMSEVAPELRPEAHKILLTMSDGDLSDPRDGASIDDMRETFDTMIVLGVGRRPFIEPLKDFTDLENPVILKVSQFSALETIIDDVIDESCKDLVAAVSSRRAAEDARRRKRHAGSSPENRRHHHKKRAATPILIRD